MDDESRPQPKIINAMEARRSFGQILEHVYYKGDQFVIERAGRPMAALVPISQLEAFQKHVAPSPKFSKRKSKRTG